MSWANETVERVTYKKKAMIKECQENQIPRFNPNSYIEEINKEKERRSMARIFVLKNYFI